MSDLIKREDAIETIHNYWKKRLNTLWTSDSQQIYKILEHNKTLCNFIEAIPSADRPQGEWINKHEWANGFYERECSICGAMKPILMHTAKVNFCPNCGAKMKGADDE